MDIGSWLQQATTALALQNIKTARLDALLFASDALRQDKSWVLAHTDDILPAALITQLNAQVARRCQHEPMAYIRGVQEFFGRSFYVTPAVLIPRPETEILIEQLLSLSKPDDAIADIGTGSGAIALTIKLERPSLHVFATDISAKTLGVAKRNAQTLGAHIVFLEQDLLNNALPGRVALIAANLPYVDPSWQRSLETNFEPSVALFAEESGLALIKRLIIQAPHSLRPNGYLLLEADPRQHQAIIEYAEQRHYQLVSIQGFSVTLKYKLI